jgi:hypothetical protein
VSIGEPHRLAGQHRRLPRRHPGAVAQDHLVVDLGGGGDVGDARLDGARPGGLPRPGAALLAGGRGAPGIGTAALQRLRRHDHHAARRLAAAGGTRGRSGIGTAGLGATRRGSRGAGGTRGASSARTALRGGRPLLPAGRQSDNQQDEEASHRRPG